MATLLNKATLESHIQMGKTGPHNIIIWVTRANRRDTQKAVEAPMKEANLRTDGRMAEAKTPERKWLPG